MLSCTVKWPCYHGPITPLSRGPPFQSRITNSSGPGCVLAGCGGVLSATPSDPPGLGFCGNEVRDLEVGD